MLDDRGPQITFEFPNAYALSEAACEQVHRRLGSSFEGRGLRIPVQRRAQQLLEAHHTGQLADRWNACVEDSTEFPDAYNIQFWDGEHRLHAGLLEFLESC